MSSKLHDMKQSAIYKFLQNNSLVSGITQSVTGPTVDMIEGDGNCNLLSGIAYASGSGVPTFDSKLQESDDGSTSWTDIAGASITTITTNATTTPPAGEFITPFQRTKRFLRCVTTVAGTTSPLYLGNLVVFEQKKYTPT